MGWVHMRWQHMTITCPTRRVAKFAVTQVSPINLRTLLPTVAFKHRPSYDPPPVRRCRLDGSPVAHSYLPRFAIASLSNNCICRKLSSPAMPPMRLFS